MRRRSTVLIILGVGIAMICAAAWSRSSDCVTLDACVLELRSIAHAPGLAAGRMGEQESAIAERMVAMDGALPVLIALLADPDKAVAQVAAKALHEYHGTVDPKYLPQIRAGLDRKLGWLPIILGSIPSGDAAREAVQRFMVSESRPGNQEAFAIQRSGARAIPFIVEAARCASGCQKYDMGYLADVVHEMGHFRSAAVPGLLSIARDPKASDDVVDGALTLLAALGHDGAAAEADLTDLRHQRPPLDFSIDEALIAIGSKQAGGIFERRLQESPEIYTLADVADAGPAARDAGPALVGLLSSPEADARLGAARALGFVGYVQAAPDLLPLLNDPTDVRLAWAAAESLGRLRAQAAETALRDAATSHWYPGVRAAASRALANLREGNSYAKSDDEQYFGRPFFRYQYMGLPDCTNTPVSPRKEPRTHKLYAKNDAAALKKLAYTTSVVGYGPAEPPPPPAAGEPLKVVELTPENTVRSEEIIQYVPHVALRVDGGWLVGGDRGEFGGELVWIADDGLKQTVLQENVEDIYRLGPRIVVVTGLAHLMLNNGRLFELARTPKGKWIATTWRVLPGAPRASWLSNTGDLLVDTYDGGTMLISAEGRMRMAPCLTGKQPGAASTETHAGDGADAAQSAVDAAQAAADAAAAAAAGGIFDTHDNDQ
jgi:HEAT repeat protein